MGKLPYIPNKKLYAAVMGACSYVRETGYFNKATQYYADKYDVSVDDVRRYVRIAQGNGQKAASKRAPRKYKWYVARVLHDYYEGGDEGYYSSWDWSEKEKDAKTSVEIVRATSPENAKSQIHGLGSMPVWAQFETQHKVNSVREIFEFATKQEAAAYAASLC